MDQASKDAMAKALGIDPKTQEVLDVGSDHAYTCRCSTCLQWWVKMGPDGGEAGNFGPFTEAEVRAAGWSPDPNQELDEEDPERFEPA